MKVNETQYTTFECKPLSTPETFIERALLSRETQEGKKYKVTEFKRNRSTGEQEYKTLYAGFERQQAKQAYTA